MLKNTCKAAKIKIMKNDAFQELDLNHFEKYRLTYNFTRGLVQVQMCLAKF